MATIFSHPNLKTDLILRLDPTEVDWTYNLNTSETATYAGQVVQILSVNFESFVIQGRFGREARDDYTREGAALVRKPQGNPLTSGAYGPGLFQMHEWFKQYFSIASQGINGQDNYNQSPVTVTYRGTYDIPVDDDKSETSWKVYPTSFPSFRIANDNFAPEWKVECQVYEAPSSISTSTIDEAIDRLQYQPLYQPGSKWSDPNPISGNPTPSQLRDAAQAVFNSLNQAADIFIQNLPTYTASDLEEMIVKGFSTPQSASVGSQAKPQQEVIPGNLFSGDPFSLDQILPGVDVNPATNPNAAGPVKGGS